MSLLDSLGEDDRMCNLQSVALIVADSLRWDTFVAAETPNIDALAPLQEQRFSYATWTQPSHACILGGLLPYKARAGYLAAAAYAESYSFWGRALAGNAGSPRLFFPEISLAVAATRSGWNTVGRVAMPVLNERTVFAHGFDDYQYVRGAGGAASFGAQVESLPLERLSRPFVFLNASETHYPYGLPAGQLPEVHGAHGIVAAGQAEDRTSSAYRSPFDEQHLTAMREAQVRALSSLDTRLPRLVKRMPKPMLLVFMSDHGELFGEGGFFGHGPFMHPKLFEVPLAVGVLGDDEIGPA